MGLLPALEDGQRHVASVLALTTSTLLTLLPPAPYTRMISCSV
eukprot:CAMPEP_0182481158 /NCGR_PEP_ID=MMETSP1319-20130603/36879_1 /TAXON_ID=172717 /ORGANISM="Bolidomonas pacifica, Strain RCC208" /LENGTH=42 /DNA_ID= /DNA_START= /DNA_END= /DNA_ORIENTATION=